MALQPEDITIAVTLYNRRNYLDQSIGSALTQTAPVRVMVVEDCGPDASLQSFVQQRFGPRVRYRRSPRRRGIFGNWNACIEQCETPWLSILHDDDYLTAEFVAAMLDLNRQAGEKGLYYGQTTVVDDHDRPRPEWGKPALTVPWRTLSLQDVLMEAPFSFPGQLFQVSAARALGGFRETSLFCGEWELWSKIIAHHGAAQTAAQVAVFRNHDSWERGTSRIHRSGKTHALITVQRRRNLALARKMGLSPSGTRLWEKCRSPLSTRFLLRYGKYFSLMYLRYNMRLLQRSPAPHWPYALFQLGTRLGGTCFVRLASRIWGVLHPAR